MKSQWYLENEEKINECIELAIQAKEVIDDIAFYKVIEKVNSFGCDIANYAREFVGV